MIRNQQQAKNLQVIPKKQMNNQKPLRKNSEVHQLLVHSVFRTIQGEGPFTGHPAVFVRLGGCNLQCPMCDTEYTEGSTLMSNNDLLALIWIEKWKSAANLVVITGGEPLRQNLTLLVKGLFKMGFYVQIETNGTINPDSEDRLPLEYVSFTPELKKGLYIVCSPKTPKVQQNIRNLACAFKYVLDHRSIDPSDGLPVTVLGLTNQGKPVAKPPQNIPIYLQPADTMEPEGTRLNVQACINSCINYGYILQIQIHKILGVS